MRPFSLAARLGIPLVVMTSFGCSWSAFNDFKNDSPLFSFSDKAFGDRVAVVTSKTTGSTILASSGGVGAGVRFFGVGNGKSDPNTDPLQGAAICELSQANLDGRKACIGAKNIAPIGFMLDGTDLIPANNEKDNCFAVGFGQGLERVGPYVFCRVGPGSGHVAVMNAPADAPALTQPFATSDVAAVRGMKFALASVPTLIPTPPPFVLGSEADAKAWLYTGAPEDQLKQRKPFGFVRKSTDTTDRFGAAVSIAKEGSGRVYLISAPGAGKIYGYTAETGADGKTPTFSHFGCLDVGAGGGETMTTGDVDGDGKDDVVAMTATGAKVWLSSKRPTTAVSDDCGATWPAEDVLYSCKDAFGVGNCATSKFGASLAVGDLNKDGKPEIAISAPFASADGVNESGGVFLYTFGQGNDAKDARSLGRPEEGDHFGTSIAIDAVGPDSARQDTLFVGAPGKSQTFVIWCTGLVGNPTTARCRK